MQKLLEKQVDLLDLLECNSMQMLSNNPKFELRM